MQANRAITFVVCTNNYDFFVPVFQEKDHFPCPAAGIL
ncbi:hypothetical protein LptCag_2265 [Leptospirillum ferriphilum]|uniref:Uncharacterized protein n=1 Tax=Leptospirillum ferriphilum TaxID=178606 RepID=A0A094YNK4_9BACT|nr:hypothetical protein LptCag_2265 [Leptospirillum ferriphilum]